MILSNELMKKYLLQIKHHYMLGARLSTFSVVSLGILIVAEEQ